MTLDLIRLVGRTVLRGLFKGGCVLRMSVGRPTADDWVYLPTLFVVWPEVLQHWSLQAVGLGQILLRKYWPPGGFMPTGNPQNTYHQYLCPYSEHQLPLPLQVTLQYQQVGLAQAPVKLLLLPLGSGVHETVCAPLKSGISVSPSPLEFLQSNLTSLQS